jgi:hypothetical protein
MRNNHFAKRVKYMKNVFRIDEGLNRLTDARVNPKYRTSRVIPINEALLKYGES